MQAEPERQPEVSQPRSGAGLAGLASLAEPTRRALYLYVHAQGSAVSRDEAAAGVGVPRHTAKFHLDKLVHDGLLKVEFARRTGRQGPGAGRPAKLYRRAAPELAITLPERRYQLAGQLMARAIAEAQSKRLPVAGTLQDAAGRHGRELGDRVLSKAGRSPSHEKLVGEVRRVLDDEGYETAAGRPGLTLANCPFRALAIEHSTVVCAMNMAIMEGLLARVDELRLAAVLDPGDGRCCVRLVARGNGGG